MIKASFIPEGNGCNFKQSNITYLSFEIGRGSSRRRRGVVRCTGSGTHCKAKYKLRTTRDTIPIIDG